MFVGTRYKHVTRKEYIRTYINGLPRSGALRRVYIKSRRACNIPNPDRAPVSAHKYRDGVALPFLPPKMDACGSLLSGRSEGADDNGPLLTNGDALAVGRPTLNIDLSSSSTPVPTLNADEALNPGQNEGVFGCVLRSTLVQYLTQ